MAYEDTNDEDYPGMGTGEDTAAPDTASDEESPAEDNAEGGEETEGEGEQGYGKETALVPKSMLSEGNIEPGSKLSFEVVHVYGDEVEIRCVKEGEGEPAGGGDMIDRAAMKLQAMPQGA